MNRAAMCLALSTMLVFAEPCMSQVFSLKEWDERATKISQENVGRQMIELELRNILESKSIPFLFNILSQADFHPLRLAAFHAIKAKHPEFELKALLLLLAESQNALIFYDPEFERLSDVLKAPSKGNELAEFLSRDFNEDHRAVLTLVLRIIPNDQLLALLENRNSIPLPATNLAAIIDRICGAFPNWRETEMKIKIIAALEEIKDSPGYCQVSILEHYPFKDDSDAIKHLQFVLEDATLPDVVAILSARRHKNLLATFQSELLAGRNKELASRRLEEFDKRFPISK